MKVTYDTEADSVFVRFSRQEIAESEEIRPGLILDFDIEGRIVGLEMLDARIQLPADAFASMMAE